MKAIVWYKDDVELAKEYIKIQIEKYKTSKIEGRVVESDHFLRFYADNGDYWETRPALESSKGVKCNISYIEEGIPIEFMDSVIRHCTTAPPFNAMTCYCRKKEEDFECQTTE